LANEVLYQSGCINAPEVLPCQLIYRLDLRTTPCSSEEDNLYMLLLDLVGHESFAYGSP
jgi:hypothetical protein